MRRTAEVKPAVAAWTIGVISLLFTAPVAWAQVASEYARPPAQAQAQYTGDKLSLNFQNIDVRAVLQVIADFTNLNVVTSDSVAGTVTLRLKDVPWDQALDIILQSKGLGVRRSGSVMLIAPREELAAKDQADLEVRRKISELEAMRTESFQLNYSRAEEVARGLLGATIGTPTVGAGIPGTPGLPPMAAPMVPGQPGAAASPRILSSRGSVIAVSRTNQLFVTDIPSKIDQVRALIEKIDIPVKQVLIEARIVEATDTFGRSLGVKLGLNDLRMQQGQAAGSFIGGGRYVVGGNYLAAGTQTLQPGAPFVQPGMQRETPSQAFTNTQFVNLPATPLNGVDPATFALSLFGASANRFLNLEISALEADGRGKVVSSPRIVTADQVEAYIKQGFRIPYRGAPNALGATSQVQFQEANLKLTVTPQITPEGNVILSVMVNKDSLGNLTPDGREINTKEVKTKVLVENGGTVVIGGIYEQEELDSRSKVPVLGDLPVLGTLFRTSGRESRRTELLVFLTPKVMADTKSGAR
jgi:type IV pilus assembly protein PilQ